MPKQIKLKTAQNKASVSAFLNTIEDEQRRKDAKAVLKIMKEITKEKPAMWGTSIVGFGTYEYTRANGDYGTFMRCGFAPRKDRITLYIMPGYEDYSELLKDLGPYTKGKACLHIKRIEKIHLPTLKKLIKAGYKDMEKKYPTKK